MPSSRATLAALPSCLTSDTRFYFLSQYSSGFRAAVQAHSTSPMAAKPYWQKNLHMIVNFETGDLENGFIVTQNTAA